MKTEVLKKILDIQEAAWMDDVYLGLLKDYRSRNKELLALVNLLPSDQQDILYDYIYAGAQLHFRLLELACEQ